MISTSAVPQPDTASGPQRPALPMSLLRTLRRGLDRVPPRVLAWSIAALFAVLYSAMSIRRHERMLSAGYDLGIFEEEIRAYAHFRAPIVALKGPGYNILGDHFSPILALLGPVYRVFPSPLTLLVAQAVLMSLACVPLALWAHRVRGPLAALVVGCGVGASWGIVKAASFDFHEVAVAVPLIAFSATALGNRRWTAAALWALPLVLVKEDLGLTAAVVGGYIAWFGRAEGRRTRLLGIGLAVFGTVASSVEMLVILPAMNPHDGYAYLAQMPGAGAGHGGAAHQLLHALLHLGWPPVKWLLLLMLLLPSAFAGLRSPLTLLCLPTLAWRLLSDNPHYWGVSYHYSAVLMPVVFAGLVDAIRPERGGLRGRPPLTRRQVRRVLAGSAAFTAITIPVYPLHEPLSPSVWTESAHVRAARQILALIPSGTTVASSNHLAAQLTDRTTVSLVCAPVLPGQPLPQWVVSDTTDPTHVPCEPALSARLVAQYRADGYRTVADRDGIVLLQRPS
ncbi:DUF2079 domain-containing protein [Streptacidiphilus albus]|uniref:DUF2079 domain-containing protein n=1 Tax=Streptacidiphilus albus TaxID=105425 RepID=UPI00068CA086|nr:DUF2079 domain-containing protein [Streptacidiphilus albus]